MMVGPLSAAERLDHVAIGAQAPARVPLRFQLGARPLATVTRRLIRLPLALDDAVAGTLPVLPPLVAGADGYTIFSLRDDRIAALQAASHGMLAFERQRYTRYFIDLTTGHDAYLARLSANTRAAMKRKARRVAAACSGGIDVRGYRSPAELEAFHAIAHALAARTYQERLFGGGLPGDASFLSDMLARGAADAVRGWLLFVGDAPAAYLYSRIDAGVVRYDYVGHDPRFADLSPGFVLQAEVLRALFAEGGLRRFDFTEGEGQHKRQFATGGVGCADLLLLRPGIDNRVLIAAMAGFARATRWGKAGARALGLERVARRLRR